MTRASSSEIPVHDFGRAVRFYEAVFGVQLEITTIDGHPMALFPDETGGVGGALSR